MFLWQRRDTRNNQITRSKSYSLGTASVLKTTNEHKMYKARTTETLIFDS